MIAFPLDGKNLFPLWPVGGILADKVGGKRILTLVFPFTAVMAIFLACPTMPVFTLGALGMAVAIALAMARYSNLFRSIFLPLAEV